MEEEVQSISSTVKFSAAQPEPEGEQVHKKRKKVKRKKKHEDLISTANFDIPGVTKIVISPLAQRMIECSVGEDVTAENPWKYVPKGAFEDNLENKSEFLPIKDELSSYPRPEVLMGYIPDESREYDEFYICLTEPAEAAVSEIIAGIRKKQEKKLNSLIFKTINPWKTQGSEPEVEELMVRNNRALLEVEFESQYPVISTRCQFRLRTVEHARDGYSELLAGRAMYENILRRRIDAFVQVTPSLSPNEAQTICTYPKNAWTQYEYKYEPIETFSPEFQKGMGSFMAENIDNVADMIYVNSYINFYKNDYVNLVRDEKYTRDIHYTLFKEYVSFIEIHLCKGKLISSVAWHPTRTGTLAIAYSDKAPCSYVKYKPNEDEVTKAVYDVTPVLLWSFSDSLHPKLFLETTREVTTISFCPFNPNLLVGGCVNGQVVIWDLTSKLKDVEIEEILTPAQQRYRPFMHSLIKWMKNSKDLKMVRLTAISGLEYSHASTITGINWISPHREISKFGQIKTIQENRTSLQFMTSSKDGTILFWDLQAKPIPTVGIQKSKILRRLKQLPDALTVETSPIRTLNKILKPIFKVEVLAPGTNRMVPLTVMNLKVSVSQYEEKPDTNLKFNITEYVYYKNIFKRPKHPSVNQFLVGTAEGDFLIASWEGFDPSDEEAPNKETCKLESYGKFHDGPVVSLSRSEAFPDLVLTVGGKVFAVWKTDFVGQPVLWRRSKHRYTHGVWNTYRPSMFRLCRDDGFTEVWHLQTRSDRYQDIKQISGGSLIGTFTHPKNTKQNVMGVADCNGSLRLFYISQQLMETTEKDKNSTHKICARDADKKLQFQKWQENWKQNNAEWIKLKKEEEQRLQKEKDEEAKRRKKQLEQEREQREKEEAMRQALLAKPQPGKFTEWADNQWRLKEGKRMTKVLLTKKALDRNLLEQQQLPLTNIVAEERQKKKKQEQRLHDAEKLYNSTVATLFPDAIEKERPPTPDPYAGGDSAEVKAAHYENYLKTAEECEELLNKQRYQSDFAWHKIIRQGKDRRKVLDGYYTRTSHRNRLVVEKRKKVEEMLLAAQAAIPPPQTSKKKARPFSRAKLHQQLD